jgi:hypothetical protein
VHLVSAFHFWTQLTVISECYMDDAVCLIMVRFASDPSHRVGTDLMPLCSAAFGYVPVKEFAEYLKRIAKALNLPTTLHLPKDCYRSNHQI